MRGALHVRHLNFVWETQAETSTFPSLSFGAEKIWTFSAPQFVSCHLPLSFPSPTCCWILRLWERNGLSISLSLPRCEGEAEVAFSWLWAQRRGLVFPAVSDCSRPAECKHALMCGVAMDTADTAQAISAHEVWGLAWPIVPLFCFSLP